MFVFLQRKGGRDYDGPWGGRRVGRGEREGGRVGMFL